MLVSPSKSMALSPSKSMALSPAKAVAQQRRKKKKGVIIRNGTTTRSRSSSSRCDWYLMIPVSIAAWFLFLDWSQRLFEMQQPPPLPEHHMLQSVPPPPLRRKQRYLRQQSYQLPGLVERNKAEHMDLLYIVTSSNEYNTGAKATRQGQDRFLEVLVPVIVESVESLISTFGHVDVYLVLGYTLLPHRQAILEQFLEPLGVGLQVWHDATPIHYDYITRTSKLGFVQEREKVLARQHRYVVKDKLAYYDFVLAFEDDMLVKNHHVLYHMEFMEEIRRLKQSASASSNTSSSLSSGRSSSSSQSLHLSSHSHPIFWGSLTVDQLNHIRPGLLRVEVLTTNKNGTTTTTLNQKPKYEEYYQAQQHQPFHLAIDSRAARSVNTHPCCHRNVSRSLLSSWSLESDHPTADQVMVWETAIAGMHVRQMPETSSLLDWVALLPIKGQSLMIPGYWSGTHGALGPNQTKKPSSLLNEYMAQSAGWMASRPEVMDFQVNLCRGSSSFVPPFEAPHVMDDGLSFFADSVEYWSGGLQLFGQQCTIQRLVALRPELFSKHLIYHTANNKQNELPPQRFTKSSTLLGQLHTVVQAARQEQYKIKDHRRTNRGRRTRNEEEFMDNSWLYEFLDGIRNAVF